MNRIKSVFYLIRPQESLPLALITLFPAILLKKADVSLLNLFLFACFISVYGFIINDIADKNLDKLNKKTRNPIAKSEIRIYQAILIACLFFILSFYFLLKLDKVIFVLGSFIAILYYLYSFLLKAKSKPFFDLIFHGIGPSILFVMGYILYKPLDFNSFILSVAIFLLFASGELLQEIRDFKIDKKRIVNTTTIIGQKASLRLSLCFILFSIVLGVYLILINLLPTTLLISVLLSYFLLMPLADALNGKRNSGKLIYILSKRGAVIGIFTLLLLLI